MNDFDWDNSFLVDFDLMTGLSKTAAPSERRLSKMKDMFHDTDAAAQILEIEDPILYRWFELGAPERAGDLAFGVTILNPGKVGDEYYMTKGHFHTMLETAEVYYTLSGEGYMIMEDPEGDTQEQPLSKGQVVYVPRRYAHRMVNTGEQPLITFFVFAADAGHDYGSIETKGYHKIVVEKDGKPAIVDNPKWV